MGWYPHKVYVYNILQDGDAEDSSGTVEPYDIFILHSNNIDEVAVTNYVSACEWKRIECLRCREMAKKAQKLFQNIQTIGSKGVRGICDHCFSRKAHDSCFDCQKIVKKFITSKRINANLIFDAKATAQTQSETKFRSPSETMLEKITGSQSAPLTRDIKIEQMFETNKEMAYQSSLDTTDFCVSNSQEISKHYSTEIDEKIIKDVKFGDITEIRKTVLETIAEMDDRSITLIVRDIIKALKEREDEDGIQIPNAKFVVDKSDEELEQLILQTIKSGNKDVEIKILELIDTQETANLHFSEIRKRLVKKYHNPKNIDTTETKLTVSDSKLHVPETKVAKARGSLEKIINQEVKLEEMRIKNKAQKVASVIRKKQLDKHLKELNKVKPKDFPEEDDERTRKLITLVRNKLQRGKEDTLETKRDSAPVAYNLFRQEPQSATETDIVNVKDLNIKTPVLKPILKGAKTKKPLISNKTETNFDLHPLNTKHRFQYDFFQESATQLQPPIALSAEFSSTKKEQKKEMIQLDKTDRKKITEAEVTKTYEKTDDDNEKLTKIDKKSHKLSEIPKKVQQQNKKSHQQNKVKTEQEEKSEPIVTGLEEEKIKPVATGLQEEKIKPTEKRLQEEKIKPSEKKIKQTYKDNKALLEKNEAFKPLKISNRKNAIPFMESNLKKKKFSEINKKIDKVSKLQGKEEKDVNLDDIAKQLERVIAKQDKDVHKNLKRKEKLQNKVHKHRSRADKALQVHLDSYVHLPNITIPEKKLTPSGVIIREATGEEYIELPFKKIRLRGPSDDDLILKLVSIRQNKYSTKLDTTNNLLVQAISERRARRKKQVGNDSESYSDYSLDLECLFAERSEESNEMIVGNKILNPSEKANYISSKVPETKFLPSVYTKCVFEASESLTIPFEEQKKKTEASSAPMNVYRMHPARPQFNWFERNNSKGLLYYDTGELLASVDNVGHARWYYKNGNIALDFYDTEDSNNKQRIVIYSSGEPDRGCPKPVTILGSFDYCGNGVVLDHSGNIRMKYNQMEGLLLDKKIGPPSHWKWHALNEPPTFQQMWVDSRERHLDPKIQKLRVVNENPTPPKDVDMERTAVEMENSVQDTHHTKGKKFRPFSIRMKTVKINDKISLRVLDQANIYVMFRDGTAKLKLNLGMILDPTEIVNVESLELKPAGQLFDSYLERCPALTDSIDQLQNKIEKTKSFEQARIHREQRLRRPFPITSSEKLTAALSRPLRIPLRTLSVEPNRCHCK